MEKGNWIFSAERCSVATTSTLNRRDCGWGLSPTQKQLPSFDDSAERSAAQSLQPKFLRYRRLHYRDVESSNANYESFVPEMRDQARTWLAPIINYPEFRDSVYQEFLRQSQDAAGARFSDPKSLVCEAALALCHKEGCAEFLIGEVAELVNAILKGRHEDAQVSPKRVGLLLRDLGIHGERVTQGYKVKLSDAVRARVHQLASEFRVSSNWKTES